MSAFSGRFLGLPRELSDPETAAAAVLPVPYEGGISYGSGAGRAPSSVLEASRHLETYDEMLEADTSRMGIVTLSPPELPSDPGNMIESLRATLRAQLDAGRLTAVIGGDHSISTGYALALRDHLGDFSVIQLDAHADLRDSYEGSRWSHACVMARLRELTPHVLQLGIRSLSEEEGLRIREERLPVLTMHELRKRNLRIEDYLSRLPDPVFLTVDADVFDWSVISSTGTPEPGGLLWDEGIRLLDGIFKSKDIAGFDLVELAARRGDRNSPFAVAKLVYRMLGLRLTAELRRGNRPFPHVPEGAFFRLFPRPGTGPGTG